VLFAALAVAACSLEGTNRAAARDATGHALAIARIMDDPWLIAEQLRMSGLAELPDDPVSAEALLHEAMTVAVDHGFEPSTACCLDALAASRAVRGLDLDAARLFGAAAACFDRIGMVRPLPGWTVVADLEQVAAGRLGPDAFVDAAAEGARLTLADAVAHARGSRGARGRPPSGWASHTPAEERVVDLVREGLTNPQIATELFVSAGTVKSHLSHIFRKLGVSTRAELASAATRRLGDAELGSVTPPR
jgi:DNA-binding CsgD family transcriptional regulator